jgi:hypothetical protein
MIMDEPQAAVREAIGIFQNPHDLEAAIDELLSSGFDRAEVSLLAGERAIEDKLGHRYRRVGSLADDPAAPRTAYVSTEAIGDAEGGLVGGLMYVGATVAAGAVVVSGGAIATGLAAAVLAGGAGGLIGALLAKWVGHRHGHYLQEQIERGGLLLWVRTWDSAHEARAADILRRHAGDCVHVHGPALTA